MKRLTSLLTAGLFLLPTSLAFGQGPLGGLPDVGADAASRLRSRASVRVPGGAEGAARIRAGANFDAARLRMDAAARNRAGVDVGGARIDSRVRADAQLQAGGQRSEPSQTTDQTGQTGQTAGRGSLHTPPGIDVSFTNRMAAIEHMRDVAIQRGDLLLLQRADALEQQLHAQYAARMEHHGAVQTQLQSQTQAGLQAGAQTASEFQSTGQSQIQAQQQIGADAATQIQDQFHGTVQGSQAFIGDLQLEGQQRMNAAAGAANQFRGQVQYGAQATGQAAGQAAGLGAQNGIRTANRAGYQAGQQVPPQPNGLQFQGQSNFSGQVGAGLNGRTVDGTIGQNSTVHGGIGALPPRGQQPAPQNPGGRTPPADDSADSGPQSADPPRGSNSPRTNSSNAPSNGQAPANQTPPSAAPKS